MELTYTKCGDYLIPDLVLLDTKEYHIGKYGRLRRAYLKEHRPILYTDLIITEKLFSHLEETDIACRERLEIIEKAMMNSELGFCRKVLSILEDFNISIEHMPSGIDTLSLIFPYSNIEGKEDEVISKIRKAVSPDHIELEKGIAMLAVVGRGMRRTRGTAARIFASMAHARINVKMIDQGSSELNIIIGVENRDFETAVKAIYDIFVLTQM